MIIGLVKTDDAITKEPIRLLTKEEMAIFHITVGGTKNDYKEKPNI